jgi:osmotically-inducible protein OsmY
MSTNATIEASLRDALSSDPRIPDPDEIAVSAEDRALTLRGTVGTFSQRRAAVHDARRIAGVDYVYDDLQVRLLDEAQREDAEIRGNALQKLIWDTEVPAELIEIKVSGGRVTLSGEVSYQFQSDAAYDDVAGLRGVVAITNEIRVVPATQQWLTQLSANTRKDVP